MTAAEMIALLAVYSARAEPIVPKGWTRPNGYTLRGPRGNRCVVWADAAGNVDEFNVRLWLDGIAYGDRNAERKRADRRGAAP